MAYTIREAPQITQPRRSILQSYIQNQLELMQIQFPDVKSETLRSWIEDDVREKKINPECDVITYPEPGECDLVKLGLGQYIKKHNKDVIAPCGTVFKSDPDNIPPSVKYNDACRLDRNKFKNLMFECMERGDIFGAQHNDGKQGLKKIKNNSIIGGHGFEGCGFYDKESFGAITSLGRNGVIMTYALTEQCLVNNFYWNDPEKIYNYVIVTAQGAPTTDTLDTLISKFGLFIPDPQLVATRLVESAKYYLAKHKVAAITHEITDLLACMTREQITYIFYRRSLINMFIYNDALFRDYIGRLCTIDTYLTSQPEYDSWLADIDPKEVKNIPDDISMMLTIIYNHILDYKAVNKELIKDHPDVAKRFALIGKYAIKLLEEYDELYIPFMYSGETIARVSENKYIVRKSVAVSDTDSILFTMKAPVSWYLKGDLKICQDGINVSAYVVYALSRLLNIANRDLAISKGAIREAVNRINLKSEYLYAVFVKTDLGKHYFTKYLAKEGRLLKEPKLDLKGVELQSSLLPATSRKFAKDLISTILDDIYTHGNVYEADIVGKCLEYEKSLLTILRGGFLNFYTNVSVKEENQYKKPESSIYFNYLLWKEVFEEDYGVINVPGKYPVVPFKDKLMRSPQYLSWLKNGHPALHARYVRFLEKIPENKKITRIPLPGELTYLPAVLLPAVDIRSIIYKNLAPAQLALRQLGIGFGKQKQCPLFLDQYTEITDESMAMS